MSKTYSWPMIVMQMSTICLLITYIHTSSAAVNKTEDIIDMLGYPVEVYPVTTKDKYILKVHHIPMGRERKNPTRNYPVLIQHGFLGSSADWVLAGYERSLPLQLADDGYDVWLANSRGTPYSRKHAKLNETHNVYWDFSLHQLGVYDLPAIIDFILNKTGKEYIHHIGNSMSTSTFYIMASEEKTETYQSKIRSHISLAPVTKLGNSKSSFKTLFAPYGKSLNDYYQRTDHGEILAEGSYLSRLMKFTCQSIMTQTLFCLPQIIFATFGTDPKHFDQELLEVIFEHYPVSTSSKLLYHLFQFMTTDSFAQFNYGPEGNQEHYQSKDPPSYDLTKIKVPITLFYATNDIMSCPEDVNSLINQLPNLANIIRIEDTYFNHVDFLWSKVVNEVVNDPIKDILQETDKIDWEYNELTTVKTIRIK